MSKSIRQAIFEIAATLFIAAVLLTVVAYAIAVYAGLIMPPHWAILP